VVCGVFMRERLIAILWVAFVACAAGCGPARPQPDNPTSQPAGRSVPKHPAAQPLFMVVRAVIHSIEAPLGTISDSEQLWSLLDERRVRVLGSGSLGLNGIRVGVGQPETWPDVVEALRQTTGRASEQQTTYSIPGQPGLLLCGKGQEAVSVFLFHNDRTLTGYSCPAGDYGFVLAFSTPEDDPRRLLMTAVPRTESIERRQRIVQGPGGLLLRDVPVARNFDALTFQVNLARDQFIVIGPNREAMRPTSLGRCLFVHRKDGLMFERIFIVRPEVLREQSR